MQRRVWQLFKRILTQRQYASFALWDLRRRYDADIRKQTDAKERRSMEELRDFECSEYEEELYWLDCRDLLRRARRVHVDVDEDVELPPGCDRHWQQRKWGYWLLDVRSYRLLARKVAETEHVYNKRRWERSDARIKWITAFGAIAATVLGLYNAFWKD